VQGKAQRRPEHAHGEAALKVDLGRELARRRQARGQLLRSGAAGVLGDGHRVDAGQFWYGSASALRSFSSISSRALDTARPS
jgi:hypothetical protein